MMNFKKWAPPEPELYVFQGECDWVIARSAEDAKEFLKEECGYGDDDLEGHVFRKLEPTTAVGISLAEGSDPERDFHDLKWKELESIPPKARLTVRVSATAQEWVEFYQKRMILCSTEF